MAVKETIAFIGGNEKTCPVLLKNLAGKDLRLLFVFSEEEQMDELAKQLNLEETSAEIELVHCAKEGCWEADMIAFINPENIKAPLVERIKEVATQKIVLCISTGKEEKHDFSGTQAEILQQLLPHSKIVRVLIDSEEMKARVSGKNTEALEVVSSIFEKPGYKTNIVAIKSSIKT